MALLFCDSFDHYTTPSQLALKWTSWTFLPNPCCTASGRNGTNGLVMTDPAGSMTKSVGTNAATLIVGFAFKMSAVSTTSSLVQFLDTGSAQVSVIFVAGSHIRLLNGGGAVIATGATTFLTNTYYYLELKVLFGNAGVGTYELRINGAVEFSGSADTTNTANNYANQVLFHNIGSQTLNVDDLYVCDGTGAQNNDFLGDVRIQAILPSGAGTTTQWTASAGANYTDVDEATPNDDTDYVSSATVGQIDTYAMGDLTPSGGTVKGIQQLFWARKDDAGNRQIAPVIHTGGVDYVGATLPGLSTTYQYQSLITELNPGTGSPFTIAEINAIECGQKVIA